MILYHLLVYARSASGGKGKGAQCLPPALSGPQGEEEFSCEATGGIQPWN